MAERGFLNIADFISYPLVTYADRQVLAPPEDFPRQPKGIVDAGFVMGLDSDFRAAENNVTLYALAVTATDIAFDFRSDASGLLGFRWLFTFAKTDPFGCTQYQKATQIGSGFEFEELGEAYVVAGDFEKLVAGISVGVHLVADDNDGNPLYVEPARIHSLMDTYTRSLIVANERRGCPAPCCPSEPSNSSSSSAGGEEVQNSAFVQQYGMQGNIDFMAGWNSTIQLDVVNNALIFGAEVGAGEGQQCVNDQWINYLVDELGLRIDTGRKVTGGCDDCGAFIRSINGQGFNNGKMQLRGGVGVYVDEVNGELEVTVDLSATCVAPESSSSA
jgi:hypothetical protein